MNRFGDSPNGMVESALEFIRIAESHGFKDMILSLKSSNPKVMVQAYRLAAARMAELGMDYPLHLGVTEAGDGEDGRIKSAIGIGSLLADGIAMVESFSHCVALRTEAGLVCFDASGVMTGEAVRNALRPASCLACPSTASTSVVVTDAPTFPLLSESQLSSELNFTRTLKPWFLKNTEFSVGSVPPFATIKPA